MYVQGSYMCLECGSPVFSFGSAPAASRALMTAVEALLTLKDESSDRIYR
jgi:hypothetical protein